MYYLHTETQEKYFEDVIRLHKSGCSNGAISRLLPVDKTTVSKWISIFVREKGQIMRVKRTETLVDPDGLRVPEPSMDEMESLRRRVKELESQLLQTEIKAEAYDEMIRVAESKFGIPIRKKSWRQTVGNLRARDASRYGVASLCVLFGRSKQAYYKHDGRSELRRRAMEEFIVRFVKSVRSKDPGIGGVKLWHMYRREFPADVRVGRDSFMSCAITTDSLH